MRDRPPGGLSAFAALICPWSDQLDAFFQDYTLERLSGIGHFTPLEAADRFGEAIKQRLAS